MITHFFTQVLYWLYTLLGRDLGLAIISLTLIIKLGLFPITLSSLKSAEKMKRIQPELNRLKQKHKDPTKLQKAQVELFKKHQINPLASFLPQVVQIVIFFMLYRFLMSFLGNGVVNGETIKTSFLWLNLTQPDQLYILPIATALSQFGLSYLMQQQNPAQPKSKNKKQPDNPMAGMGKTMVYVMPLITGFFATKFPSGLVIYWFVSTVFSLIQQVYLIKQLKRG